MVGSSTLADRVMRHEALLAAIKDRQAMMIGRGVLAALETGGGVMRGSVTAYGADDVLDDREFVQDYGISSRPHPGAEALMAFLGGLRSNGLVVRLFDGRYQLALQYGEVAIHDDLGQAVHLTRTGIDVRSPLNITVTAGETLRLAGKVVQVHAEEKLSFDTQGYGNAVVWQGGGAWLLHTWQTGAVTSSQVDPIKPPEGP